MTLLSEGSAVDLAPAMLGWTFRTNIDGDVTSVRLTEVEAYMGADDPASHAYRGVTPRTRPMFEAGGVVYVYLSYGVHFCVNIVTGPAGVAQAVLLRGGIPIEGIEIMEHRRGRSTDLTNGPGKLGQALGLTTQHSGLPIDGALISLERGDPPSSITTTPRIGITKAPDRPWRFVADPPEISDSRSQIPAQ
ncbi:MAG: DNA-3-methyladenine glycosylase [Acidimicrobiia bacterium]|nr:DNA-3-methyladenine glycosylase [Acidimicrobiia bacterium]